MRLRSLVLAAIVTAALPVIPARAVGIDPPRTPDSANGSAAIGCQQVPRPDSWVAGGESSNPLAGEPVSYDPLVSAHRGANLLAPENTRPAFEIAIAYGVDLLEADIRPAKDGVYVVMHDETVDRTTDGSGAVHELTYAQIAELDASEIDGRDWSAQFPDGLHVPRLEEVAALARDHGVGLELDFKLDDAPVEQAAVAVREVADIVASYGLVDQSVFNSYDPVVAARYPGARFIYNVDTFEPPGSLFALATATRFDVFGSRRDEFTPGRVNEIHDACAAVMPHSYDEGPGEEARVLREMRAAGIDGAQTNQPELAAQHLAEPVPTSLRVGPLPATPGRLDLTSETIVDGTTHKQGLARVEGGWVHTWNEGLLREDDGDRTQAENRDAIPADAKAAGFDHIGDPDVHGGLLYVPIEQDDYARRSQLLARYDAETLALVDTVPIALEHAAWFAVATDGAGRRILWSTSDFTDVRTVQRFAVDDHDGNLRLTPLADIALDRTLQRVQGGDVAADGTLWLSTDDAGHRIFIVDPRTGHVTDAGSLGHLRAAGPADLTGPAPLDTLADGEGEGIDVTELPSGFAHTLTIDATAGISHFAHFARRSVLPAVPARHACLVHAGNGAGLPYQPLTRNGRTVATTGPDGCTRVPGGPLAYRGGTGALPADRPPLERAHAHNDNLHDRPLFDALAAEFTSVEADVYLVGDQLVVGHDPADPRPGRTLQSLYLDPLRERVRQRGGVHRLDERHFQLLVDVKTEAESTWAVLDRVLAGYDDILTAYGADTVITERPVRVVVSGDRARARMAAAAVRYAAYDGRIPDDLADASTTAFMPLVSQNLASMPGGVAAAVASAHARGRAVRFWNVPGDASTWQSLLDADVDWINTDDLEGLSTFLRGPR